MKVAILAGGYGSRLAELTNLKPKPMVEIGGIPILWHIMMHYSHYQFKEFVIALGYKGEVIKKYMTDYALLMNNLSVDLLTGTTKFLDEKNGVPDWQIELINTGLHTNTGGRIKRLAPYIGNETFMLTWGMVYQQSIYMPSSIFTNHMENWQRLLLSTHLQDLVILN